MGVTRERVAAGMFDHLVTPSGAKIAHGVADLASFAFCGLERVTFEEAVKRGAESAIGSPWFSWVAASSSS